MATTSIPSASVRAKAMTLLHERHRWVYARNKETGRSFIVVPSSDGTQVHRVHPSGNACSCPAYQTWGYAICSHMLAVREANSEDALAQIVADRCRKTGCQEPSEMGEQDCSAHVLVDAF